MPKPTPFVFTSRHGRLRLTATGFHPDYDPARKRNMPGKTLRFEGGRAETRDPDIIEHVRSHWRYGISVFETEEQARLDPRVVFEGAEPSAEQQALDTATEAAMSQGTLPPVPTMHGLTPEQLAEAAALYKTATAAADAKAESNGATEPPADASDEIDFGAVEPAEDGFFDCPYPGCEAAANGKRFTTKGALIGHSRTHAK